MVGFGESYFPAFALALGASAFQAGLLVTVPMLIGSLFQPLAPILAARVGAKRWVSVSAVVQGLVFVPVIVLALRGAPASAAAAALMVLVCVYWVLGLGVNAVWGAWIGSLVPPSIRSRFFSRRTVPIQAVLFGSMILGGAAVHFANAELGSATIGFAAIFAAAGASRLVSAHYLRRHHDIPTSLRLPRLAGELPAGSGGRPSPYKKLILLAALLGGSVNIASPFFTPYMLQELHLSYGAFTAVNAAVALSRVLSAAYWGEIGRSYGNRRAMQVAALLIVPLPALWLVSTDVRYLFVLQLLAGFAWAGYELTLFLNFFDCTDDHDRARVLAFYNLWHGVSVVVGSLVGGLLLRHASLGGYTTVFLASSALRALVVLFFASGTGLRRADEHSFENVFLRVVSFRPGQGPRLRPAILSEYRRKRRRPGGEV